MKHIFLPTSTIADKIFRPRLTLSLPAPCWAEVNADLPSNSNISKTIKVDIFFTKTFSKEYSRSLLMICKLIDFVLVVL